MKLFKRLKTHLLWYLNKNKLDDETIPLFNRAILATTLINEHNRVQIPLTQAMDYSIESPIHSMIYLIDELNRIISSLIETKTIAIPTMRVEVRRIRLDKFIVPSIDSEFYDPNYGLYECYVDASRLILTLFSTIKEVNTGSDNKMPESYIERRTTHVLKAFIILTQIQLEFYYKKL